MQTTLRTIIRLSCLVLIWLTTVSWSYSGDFAQRNIIGFTPDGSRFAFEEFGIQDGSGFPYSNIYVIDTTADNWVDGTPYRTRIDNENATLEAARNQTRSLAGSTLNNFSEPGFIAATNTHTEVLTAPYTLVANPRSYIPTNSPNLEFRLEVYDVRGEDYCNADGTVKAFRLIQTSSQPGFVTRLLHDDGQDIPSSRGCTQDYGFADLVTYYPPGGGLIGAVLIRYHQLGFEGPDGRYLAVTFKGE